MKNNVLILLFALLAGGGFWAQQCQDNPYRRPAVQYKKPIHSKYHIRRINQAPIRRIQRYPSYSYPTYRKNHYTRNNCSTPRTYVYTVPSRTYISPPVYTPSYPETQENTTYVYNNYYEYIDDSEPEYEPYSNQEPVYTPPTVSENRTNSFYVEQRPEEDTTVEEPMESSPQEEFKAKAPIPDFFYYLQTGKEFFKREQYEQAAKEFSQAALLDRYSYAAHWGHGMSLFALGRYSSASFSIRKGFDLITNPFGVRENLRDYYRDLSLFDEQILQLQKYLTTYPFDLDAHFFLAFAHFYTKNYAASLSILDYILKIDPQDAHASRLKQSIAEEFERRKQYQIPMPTMPHTETVPTLEEAPQDFSKKPSFQEDREFEDQLLELSKPDPLVPQSEEPVLTPEELAPVEGNLDLEKSTEKSVEPEIPAELTPEEKKRIIEENNAKALENYEKILENANYSKTKNKTSSPLQNTDSNLPMTNVEVEKPQRTRKMLLQEIALNQQQFQDKKLHIVNEYANLKQRFYDKQIEEAEYQAKAQRHNQTYKQAIQDYESRKKQLETELSTLR